ncbi:hypothetical protein DB35_15285 [Streptomyces abyssalis]|uniref:Uncharacterized protein n=1 Tax=Streptomyces abyssalis TaxID=933944 RepID=A0A1E7JFY1_9ACTN|nr:DUF6157 family protein [Streptomyces abyssalis]OEU85378.1 hypothetical protein AN215_22725 [Streptomyces abyssalis]OEU93159.1 hypothetical protein DB35_15285 [Streptomyces abyssalis]
MNYFGTLIAVADDCPVTRGVVPAARGGRKTVAVLQYEMLTERPGRLTQEDVLFESWFLRRPGAGGLAGPEAAALREEFFSKEQPCLRASPLPKKYGFGLLFDDDGLVTLCPVESGEYARLAAGAEGVTVLKALRSARR